jgi:hypothetical protein
MFFFAPAKKNMKSRAEIDVQPDSGIKLLYYCGEQQCSPDARIKFNIVSFFPLSVSDTVSLLSGKS